MRSLHCIFEHGSDELVLEETELRGGELDLRVRVHSLEETPDLTY
jgi:hypothetical protein